MARRNVSGADRAEGDGRGRPRGTRSGALAPGGTATALGRHERRPVCGPDEVGEGLGPRALATRAEAYERLDTLIVRQWTKSLKGPFDWGEWPLARYTIGADVLDSAELGSPGSARRVAWACAMVACGRAPRLRSLDPQPLRGPDGAELERADGARGWSCDLQRTRGERLRLRYWAHPSGLVEFDAIVGDEGPCPAG